MGCIGSKNNKSAKNDDKSSGNMNRNESMKDESPYKGKLLNVILEESATANEFRSWLKKRNKDFYDLLLLYELTIKRSNVYSAGIKCGDNEDELKEKNEKNGQNIVEKYGMIAFYCTENKTIKEWADKGIDLSEAKIFDAISMECRNKINDFLK